MSCRKQNKRAMLQDRYKNSATELAGTISTSAKSPERVRALELVGERPNNYRTALRCNDLHFLFFKHTQKVTSFRSRRDIDRRTVLDKREALIGMPCTGWNVDAEDNISPAFRRNISADFHALHDAPCVIKILLMRLIMRR
jgi:hypothetical protein